MTDPFVTTGWLADHLSDPDLAVIDASWYLPTANRDGRAEYLAAHIPGAVFFDIDAISDKATSLPHMLLAPDAFAKAVGALGIGDGMKLVVYDGEGLFSAPRARWNFLIMGAPDVALLEGGLKTWRAEGRPFESGDVHRPAATFTPRFDPGAVADLDMMRELVANGKRQIVDGRPAGRFTGEAPEPRPGIPSGHMPGAMSMPGASLVERGALKSADALRALAAEAGVALDRPIVTTCGSGVVATTLKLALERAGAIDVIVYDGSWSEWASQPGAAVETG